MYVAMLVYWYMPILNANENEILNKGRESKKYALGMRWEDMRRRGFLHYYMIEIGDCTTFSLPVLLGVV